MKRNQTVTNGDWGVGYTTGSGIQGAVLHVYRHHMINGRHVSQKGDGYGKVFPSVEAASAWALEHGYLQRAVTPWCPACRELHLENRYGVRKRRSAWCSKEENFVFNLGRA